MRASIEPLSAVPDSKLKDHLLRYGLSAGIIDWKYFDRAFRPRQERGYAWIRDDRVRGTVGMIPFRLAGPDRSLECAWTCDWFVESSKLNPGIGVLLLRGAIEQAGLLVSVGGNEATSRLVPRLAAHTNPEAAIEVALALTVGGTALYGRLERRVPIPGLRELGALPMPFRRSGAPRKSMTVCSQPGVHHRVADLLDEAASEGWTPAYDMGHLEWQLMRCPAVEAASTYAVDGVKVRAAAVFWRAKADRRQWRLVLWLRKGDDDGALAVLNEVMREISRAGGQSLSAMVGRREGHTLRVLAAAGFRSTGRSFPLYVLSSDSTAPVTELSRLGYLDSDLGHRF